jgi:putative adhesin
MEREALAERCGAERAGLIRCRATFCQRFPSNLPMIFMYAQLRSSRFRSFTGAGVLLAVLACPAVAKAQQAKGSFQRTLTVAGPVDLEVLTGSGSVDVRTGQAGRVEIAGRVTAGDWELFSRGLRPQERVRRIEARPPIEQTGTRVSIGRIDDDELKNVSISYTLVVPPDTTLTSKTGSGSHLIEGVRGVVTVSAGSGSIRVRDAGSEVRASTGSGSILADTVAGSFSASSGSGSIEGSNVKGGITVKSGSGDISVSQSGGGQVEASSGSGSIHLIGLRGPVRASTSSGTLRVQGEQTSDWRLSTSSGSVTIELAGKPAFTLDAHSNSGRIDTQYPVTVGRIDRRDLRGSVNGGGPLLQVRTSSGGIHIR